MKINPKFIYRALLLAGAVSIIAIVTHMFGRADAWGRAYAPIGALFIGGVAAGFPWLGYAMMGNRQEEAIPGFFVLSMRLFLTVGAIGWIISAFSMFDLDDQGSESVVGGFAAVSLATSAWMVLQKKKAPNQQPEPTRSARGSS